MSPTHPTAPVSVTDLRQQQLALQELVVKHRHWFMTADGRPPLHINHDEFEFLAQHNRLMFSCWTEAGSRTWRVTSWKCSWGKLLVKVTRRMGAEAATIELIPRASARAIVAGIEIGRASCRE